MRDGLKRWTVRSIYLAMRPSRSRLSPSAVWKALTRRRSHQLLDLLLGGFALITVSSAVGSVVNPLLGILVFTVGVGFYLASLAQSERGPVRLDAASPPSLDHSSEALDALDDLLATASPIPLTDRVRVDPKEVTPLVDAVRAMAPDAGFSGQADDLAQAILGRQIPFTGQLQVDRRRAQRLLSVLREAERTST